MKIIRILFVIFVAVFFAGCVTFSNDDTYWFAELEEELNNFNKSLQHAQECVFKMEVKVINQKFTQTLKSSVSPFYIESTVDNDLEYLIKEENGRVFQYRNTRNCIERRYLGEMSDINAILASLESGSDKILISEIVKIDLNRDNTVISKPGYEYVISAKYNDLADEEIKLTLRELVSILGLTTKSLEEDIVISVFIREKSLYYTVSAEAVRYKRFNKDFEFRETYPIKISFDISLKKFPFADYLSPDANYRISKPTRPEEVLFETDISEGYELTSSECVYVYLEKGPYLIDLDNYLRDVRVTLFGDDNKRFGYSFQEVADYNNIIIAPESGYYYLIFEKQNNYKVMLWIVELEYETFVDFDRPKVLREDSGKIEGEHDIEYYEYHSDKRKVIAIKNTGSEPLYLLGAQNKEIGKHEVNPGEYVYMGIDAGINCFYIVNAINPFEESKPYYYSFTVEEYELEHGFSKASDEMKQITETFSEEYYAAGLGLPAMYLKLNAEKKGTYRFDCDCLEPWMSIRFQILNEEGGIVSSMTPGETALLGPGEYVIKITNDLQNVGIGKVKYAYVGD